MYHRVHFFPRGALQSRPTWEWWTVKAHSSVCYVGTEQTPVRWISRRVLREGEYSPRNRYRLYSEGPRRVPSRVWHEDGTGAFPAERHQIHPARKFGFEKWPIERVKFCFAESFIRYSLNSWLKRIGYSFYFAPDASICRNPIFDLQAIRLRPHAVRTVDHRADPIFLINGLIGALPRI